MSQKNSYGQSVGDALPDWQPCPRPERVRLEGTYCDLEPLSVSYADALFKAHQMAKDTRSWTWLLREPDPDLASFRDWVESVSQLQDPLHFAVIDRQTAQAVGSLSLMRINPEHGVIEVGHVHFSPLLTQTPASTEAQWLLMRYAFETLGYRRYEWKCNSLNEPSRNAALRLGFQYEGRFRQALVIKGHNRDTDWFSILDKEWPLRDQALRNWLARENFDPDGKQLRPLSAWQQPAS